MFTNDKEAPPRAPRPLKDKESPPNPLPKDIKYDSLDVLKELTEEEMKHIRFPSVDELQAALDEGKKIRDELEPMIRYHPGQIK